MSFICMLKLDHKNYFLCFIVFNFVYLMNPLSIKSSIQSLYAAPPIAKLTYPTLIPSLDLQGHRGARGLYPENTIPAFQAAIKYGMNTIELDTTITRDQKLIVYHDTRINTELCQINPTYSIQDPKLTNTLIMKLESTWFKALDCGRLPNKKFPSQKQIMGLSPPLLEDVFAWEKSQYHQWSYLPLYNIEIKVDTTHGTTEKLQAVQALQKTLARATDKDQSTLLQRITIQSFDLEIIKLVKQKIKSVRTSALFAPSRVQLIFLQLPTWLQTIIPMNPGKAIIQAAKSLKVEIISPYHAFVSTHFIKHAHAHNIKVIPWTVNEKEHMKELILLGVDGLISDYPDRLIDCIESMSKAIQCRTRFSDQSCTQALSTLKPSTD